MTPPLLGDTNSNPLQPVFWRNLISVTMRNWMGSDVQSSQSLRKWALAKKEIALSALIQEEIFRGKGASKNRYIVKGLFKHKVAELLYSFMELS